MSYHPRWKDSGDKAGARLRVKHLERSIMAFAITDEEMSSLSHLNAETIIYSSVGGFLLGTLWDVVRDNFKAMGVEDPWYSAVINDLVPGIIIAALFCFGMAFWKFKSRRSRLRAIKDSSKEK